jgi:hypothetical protein
VPNTISSHADQPRSAQPKPSRKLGLLAKAFEKLLELAAQTHSPKSPKQNSLAVPIDPTSLPQFDNCIVMRRKLLTYSQVRGDGFRRVTGQEWKTQPCNAPLFYEEEKRTGICNSCASGWDHPKNQLVDKAVIKAGLKTEVRS